MRYSLRSLMIVVALICVVFGLLGARIEYLRRQAEFYKQEAKKLDAIIIASPSPQSESVKRRFGIRYDWYAQLSKQYRQAMYRPWTTVDDAPPKQLELEKWPDGKVPRSVFADP